MDWTTPLRYLHILAAMVYVAGYMGAALLSATAARASDRTVRLWTLRQSNFFSSRILTPGFIAAGILGVATALAFGYPLTSGWVLWALILYVVSMALGIAFWAPLGKKLLATAQEADESRYLAIARQPSITAFAVVDTLILLALIWLMVARPAL